MRNQKWFEEVTVKLFPKVMEIINPWIKETQQTQVQEIHTKVCNNHITQKQRENVKSSHGIKHIQKNKGKDDRRFLIGNNSVRKTVKRHL